MNNKYDLFISHASEDKDAIARPLCKELLRKGYSVFLDELVIKLGDSITESINQGLSDSQYCILIISPVFLSKRWTRAELNSIVNLMISEKKTILPIWHNIKYEDVKKEIPLLSDRLAISTSVGIKTVTKTIMDKIGDPINKNPYKTNYLWNIYDCSPELQIAIFNNIGSLFINGGIDLMDYHDVLSEVEFMLHTIKKTKLKRKVRDSFDGAKQLIDSLINSDMRDLENDR